MKTLIQITALAIGLLMCASSSYAQETTDSEQYSPLLTDRFQMFIGGFWPEKSFEVSVNGSSPNDEVDFDEALRLDDDELTFAGNFRWKFGSKWSLWAQAWHIQDSGGYFLDEPEKWEDLVFKEGSFAEVGMDASIARLFFGRQFFTRPNQEFGIGAGFHWLELEAFMQGQVLTNKGDTEFARGDVSTEFPLPNIGAWYHYSWSRNWMFGSRVDWLSASVDKYSGQLWNLQLGVSWTPFRNFGLGLHYTLFELNGKIKEPDWRGKVDSKQHGPMLSLSISW